MDSLDAVASLFGLSSQIDVFARAVTRLHSRHGLRRFIHEERDWLGKQLAARNIPKVSVRFGLNSVAHSCRHQ